MASKLEKPLVVIVGPTASGKTALAVDLAEKYGGEIVCADSRTVYKGMDIGTAKPTTEERARIPHHLIDIVLPSESFTAADFQQLAQQAIVEIRSRGKTPFLVGGSGLYIDSVVFNYTFGGPPDPKFRRLLEAMSVEELQEYCVKNSIKLPENTQNKRYLVRAIEQKGVNNSSNEKPIDNCVIVGISTDKQVLKSRIDARIDVMFSSSVVNEAINIGKQYGWDVGAMSGNIYRFARAVYEGAMPLEEAREKTKVLDWRLAKRQLTWFKRNPYTLWKEWDEARMFLQSYLEKGEHDTIRTR